MSAPSVDVPFDLVRCSYCGGTYQLGYVTVTARYADCSVWNTPCCGRQVDDRGETGWKSTQDYRRVSDEGPKYVDHDGTMFTINMHGDKRLVRK